MIALAPHDPALDPVRLAIVDARRAQLAWAEQSPRARARAMRELRILLAENASRLAHSAAAIGDRPVAEKMVSEVLPLLEAARFLEKNVARIFRAKKFAGHGRPFWLRGHSFTVTRKPFGVILIVGPSNYPLFLPAVQALQALAAGNAVVVKPAQGATAPLTEFAQLVRRAGFPSQLLYLLPEPAAAAREAVRCGIDKAIFTGSSKNGRDFLALLAQTNTPSVMELSGQDHVFVRADADLDLAAKAIAFGLRLNDGNTCIAPHTVLAHNSVAVALTNKLKTLAAEPTRIIAVSDDNEALQITSRNEYGLGASIFSRDEKAARVLADKMETGFVTINDMIVPTADPRFPFGGIRGSGVGVTRGEEGLLEMTYPQAVSVRHGRAHPHLGPAQEHDADLFAAFAGFAHGRGTGPRFRSLRRLFQLGAARMKGTRK
ncbi:MAG: aldehyde dehydrogenase family protein [Chthoniobacterales bacterium]